MRLWSSRMVCGLVFALVLCLVGPGLTPTAAKTILEVHDWKGNDVGAIRDWLEANKASFEAKYPDVEVQYTFADSGSQGLITRIASGTAPDVAFASVSFARDLYDAGAIRSLNPYIEKSPHVMENLIPVHLPFTSANGAQFGIPVTLTASALVYNKDMFSEAGLATDPQAMKSWDDFEAFSEKLTRFNNSGEVVRAALQQSMHIQSFSSWLNSNGASFFNEDYTGAGFDNDQGEETLTYLRDIQEKIGMLPGFQPNFFGGTAAMMYYETYGIGAPGMANIENPGVTSVPVGPSGTKRGSIAWSNMYTIPTDSPKPDLAWKFIEHVSGFEASLRQLSVMGGIPFTPRQDVYQTDDWRNYLAQRPILQELLDVIQVAGPWPFRRYGELSPQVTPLLRDVMASTLAPRIAAEQAAEVMARILRD